MFYIFLCRKEKTFIWHKIIYVTTSKCVLIILKKIKND